MASSILSQLTSDDFQALVQGPAVWTDLCQIMADCGSDKSTWHNYTWVYDRLFAKFRDADLNIFELGIGTQKIGAPSTMHGMAGTKPGGSLRGWQVYFPKAKIYSADIDADILFQENHIKTFWVDQRDNQAIRQMWAQLENTCFDVIIDDGLHEATANIRFFMESWVKWKEAGIYVIEDILPEQANTILQAVSGIEFKNFAMVELLHPHNNIDNRLLVMQKGMSWFRRILHWLG